MSPDVLKSGEFKLAVEIMSLTFALVAVRMAHIEWRRGKSMLDKYIALSFVILLLSVFIDFTGTVLSLLPGQYDMPLPLELLQDAAVTGSYIFLAAAFALTKTSFRSKFIKTNSVILLVLVPLTFIVTLVFKSDNQYFLKLSHYLVFEAWHTGLLILTVRALTSSVHRFKQGFLIATALLLSNHILSAINELVLSPQSPALLFVTQLLTLFYFATAILVLHNEMTTDLVSADEEKAMFKETAHRDTLRALISSLEAKDEYTRGHSVRVTEYAMTMGREIGLSQKELTNLYYGAILHDIGKIGISEEILNHPHHLRGEDFDIIKKHPEIGATIISSIESLKHIAPAILYHHERFDGSGYPKELKGEEIPLHARIIAISDALDAMLSTRTYRHSLSEEKAARELISGAGTQFDPCLVQVAIRALGLPAKESELKKLGISA